MNYRRMFLRYCWSVRRSALMLAGCCAMLFLLTELYHAPAELPRYTSLFLTTLAAVFFVLGFARFVRAQQALEVLRRHLPMPLEVFPEEASGGDTLAGDVLELARAIEEARCAQRDEFLAEKSTTSDYYSLWTHQAKTPLAALRLMVQEDPGLADRGAFLTELYKLEQYVDMALGYTRLASFSSTLSPAPADLAACMRAAARRTAPLFLYQSHTRFVLNACEVQVVTDEGWLTFVLEQLLTNAAKYTPSGTVELSARPSGGGAVLTVRDTGLGIAREDLPRVCERGFTGGNGLGRKRATGIGLYLCKEVLGRLGHGFSIDSTQGEGTTVTITFERPKLILE